MWPLRNYSWYVTNRAPHELPQTSKAKIPSWSAIVQGRWLAESWWVRLLGTGSTLKLHMGSLARRNDARI